MSEPTSKLDQVRALREARFKKWHTGSVKRERPTKAATPPLHATPAVAATRPVACAECEAKDEEIRRLKRLLAEASMASVRPPPMTSTERARKRRANLRARDED